MPLHRGSSGHRDLPHVARPCMLLRRRVVRVLCSPLFPDMVHALASGGRSWLHSGPLLHIVHRIREARDTGWDTRPRGTPGPRRTPDPLRTHRPRVPCHEAPTRRPRDPPAQISGRGRLLVSRDTRGTTLRPQRRTRLDPCATLPRGIPVAPARLDDRIAPDGTPPPFQTTVQIESRVGNSDSVGSG